jgi:hypothetical protein
MLEILGAGKWNLEPCCSTHGFERSGMAGKRVLGGTNMFEKLSLRVTIAIAVGALLLGAGCASVIRQELHGGPYPPSKTLPQVVDKAPEGSTYIGYIIAGGTRNGILKLAAKRGATIVEIKPTQVETERTIYEMRREGDYVNQYPIGTETVLVNAHEVFMFR